MPTLHNLIPDPAIVLSLEPEQLAGYLIEHLNSLPPFEQARLNRYNFSLGHTFEEYPQPSRNDMAKVWMEAWMWLEREGMIIPNPGQQGEWMILSRRGQRMKGRQDLMAYQKASRLPKQLLHPVIAQKVWSQYIRGEYNTAVFQAFKEVEVAVREAGSYQPTDLGIELVREAFHAERGPLTDLTRPLPERQALAHLFAGAIGSYKNPTSHRHVPIGADEATEMLILASHLLRIIDDRAAALQEPAEGNP